MPDARLWAVVKADGYGHGLAWAMQGFAQADGLSLVELDRAVRLRELGWTKPVMMIEGPFSVADIADMQAHALQPVIHNEEQLAMLASAPSGAPLDVHLKINTGMNRLGFAPGKVRDAYARLKSLPVVRSISLLTHFANAENPAAALTPAVQMARFRACTDGLQAPVSLSRVVFSMVLAPRTAWPVFCARASSSSPSATRLASSRPSRRASSPPSAARSRRERCRRASRCSSSPGIPGAPTRAVARRPRARGNQPTGFQRQRGDDAETGSSATPALLRADDPAT